MSLAKIHIQNYKSIRDCSLNIKQLTVLLGENGTGKSNILSAIRYFYDNLVYRAESDEIFDHNNPFSNRVEIALTYDLGRLKSYSLVNLSKLREKGGLGPEDERKKRYYGMISGLASDDRITIRMVKIKDKPVRWSHDIETRKLICSLFPLYFVDSRQIDLVNWNVLWKHIGDLMKLENDTGQELQAAIKGAIAGANEHLQQRLEKIEGVLEQQNIRITQYSKNEFAAALAQMYFCGNQYGFEENKLSEFSNGTNSFNFTYLLIYILKIIAETKMKEPVMVLDEPEISLHNKMIDSLAEIFYQCRDRVKFLIASHSARLVKDILVQDGEENQLYQVYRKGGETKISRFHMLRQTGDVREKYFITDQHASAYFSKALLLVEGETELEVFQNRFLKAVFPHLGQIEVLKGMSDDVVYRILSPRDRGCRIPVTMLLDLDKIYSYSFRLKKKYFDLCKGGEKFFFFKKGDTPSNSRAVLGKKRRRIFQMAEKCKFHYEYPLYRSEDENFEEFIWLIQSYFREYGIFVAQTTIEGMLVTETNLEIFLEFMKEYYPKEYKAVYPFDYRVMSQKDRVGFIRLLLGGECDYGMRFPWIQNHNPNLDPSLAEKLKANHFAKTKWTADWLRYYFCREAGLENHGPEELYRFMKKIQDEKEKKRIRQKFQRDFPEMARLLQMVQQMI